MSSNSGQLNTYIYIQAYAICSGKLTNRARFFNDYLLETIFVRIALKILKLTPNYIRAKCSLFY